MEEVERPSPALPPALARRMSARLLGLQAVLSFDRAQGLGFAYAVEPWLARLLPEEADRRRAMRRHFEFFNTHPYLAGLVVGMTCALEEDAARGPVPERDLREERVVALKRAVAAALAGIGDALFWATLRPCAAALALSLGAALWRWGPAGAAAAGVAAYLALFNIPAASLRLRGVSWGYSWREKVAEKLGAIPWQSWRGRARVAGTGLSVAGLAAWCLQTPGGWTQALAAAAALWALAFLDTYGVTAGRLYAGACLLGMLVRAVSGGGD